MTRSFPQDRVGANERPGSDVLDRAALGGMAALILGLALFLAASPGVYLGDDAMISMTYARHLAAGEGLVFNPGERVWGFTSPLQTLLLGGVMVADLDPLRVPTALAAIEIGLAIVLLLALARPATGSLGALAAIALFFQPRLHLFPGLEGSLLVLLQAALLLALARRRLAFAGLLAALSCLARPDSLVMVAPLLLAHAGFRRARCWLAFAVPGALWIGFALLYYGAWLPNTLGAKAGSSGFFEYLIESWRWLTGWPFSLGSETPGWLRAALFTASLLPLALPALRRNRTLLFALVPYPWLLVAAYAAIGAPTYYRWEIYSAQFFFSAACALGLAGAIHRALAWLRDRSQAPLPLRQAAATLVLALFLVGTASGAPRLLALFDEMQDGFVVGARFETYRAVAEWIDVHLRSEPELAHYEVGTLGYFTRRVRLIDTGGLVSPRTTDEVGLTLLRSMIRDYRPAHLLRTAGEDDDELRIDDLLYRRTHVFPDYGYYRFALYSLVAESPSPPKPPAQRRRPRRAPQAE